MKTPDEILKEIETAEKKKNSGKLKIFFGMCAGVGKTYSMLQHAKDLIKSGQKVLVGYIETHGRSETQALLEGFEILPRLQINYKSKIFEEFDLETTIKLKPDWVLVDELAHSNIPGTKHSKRYQDVLELLDAGINVFTTVNVQHIESRSKTVEQITGIPILETVPDSIIEIAEDIELVDLPIEELLTRLNEGKVYVPEKVEIASKNFFKTGNLISLREMALRLTAEKVESDLVDYMSEKNIQGPWKAGDKILVAVGASPFSAELIRWTRRIAYSLKTKWYAVYVRTNTQSSPEQEKQLEKNLRLAKELGAEVITTANTDLVTGLIETANKNNVTQIIIGKPAKYNLFNYIKKDNYIDRLINESGDIDIYIVRPNQIKSQDLRKNSKINLKPQINKREYFISTLSVILLSSICFPFKEFIGYQTVGLILLLNIIILPFFISRGPIILAAILNGLFWNFFFIPPLFTLEIDKLHDVITLILNFVIALSGGLLSSKIIKNQELVKIRELNTFSLLNYTKDLAAAKNKTEVIQTTIQHIDKVIQSNVIFYSTDMKILAFSRESDDIGDKEISIVKWCIESRQVVGKFTNSLPNAKYYYIPIIAEDDLIGVLGLRLESKLNIESETLINNYITQMLGVYEKETSREMLQKLELDKQSQKLYDTLIDSISHEFRTPIAVISGASSILFDDKVIENHTVVSQLAEEIYTASKRIDILVENLLDINRLESGRLKLNKSLCLINEIIIDVIRQLSKEKGERKIKLNFEEFNTQINVDPGFIGQALSNIILNALTYTTDDTIIEISTILRNNRYVIQIKDEGPGVPDGLLNKLFDKFYRIPNSKAGGTGLGLSITKGFIEAHDGKISVIKNIPTGLIFVIELPI